VSSTRFQLSGEERSELITDFRHVAVLDRLLTHHGGA